jgi:APA family basic amino acid/polyamine antiporter
MRYKAPELERPYRTWGYPVVPALYVLFCMALVINTIITQPREAIIGISLVAAGIPLFFYFRKNMEQ